MTRTIAIFAAAAALAGSASAHRTVEVESDCTFNGIALYGQVEAVDSFGDIKVEVVDSFPDLKVQKVDAFADDCGEWEMVDSFGDFTVEFVDSFGDVKVQWVDSFPGLP